MRRFFDNGEKKIESNINTVLKQIGVERSAHIDEFDTINLDEYRESEYYYCDSEDNKALKKTNMIPGRLFNKN
jgi:division protein CdvB (Snf7/Vps24/ESCRT-III family)